MPVQCVAQLGQICNPLKTEHLAILRKEFRKIQSSIWRSDPWEPIVLLVIITKYNKVYAMPLGQHQSGHVSDEKLMFLNNFKRLNIVGFCLMLAALLGPGPPDCWSIHIQGIAVFDLRGYFPLWMEVLQCCWLGLLSKSVNPPINDPVYLNRPCPQSAPLRQNGIPFYYYYFFVARFFL